jgi:hypothetical protein
MKREKEEKTKFWTKVMLILIAVLFVGMMILSSMGTGWLTTFRTVKPLDTLAMQYTLRDGSGQVILTTDKTVYQTALKNGDPVFYTTTLDILAGKTGNPAIQGVPAYNPYVGEVQFGLLGLEADEMGAALLGLRAGETKKVTFVFEDPLQVDVSEEEFNIIGGNFSTSVVGDWIPIGFSETPRTDISGENETPPNTVIRMARIVEKTNTSALLGYRYPTAEISFAGFPK